MWEDEDLPPESTTFEFPLYLNTRIIEKTPDSLYRSREADDILNQLRQFYMDNYSRTTSGSGFDSIDWPINFFKDYPVFIDGYQVEDIERLSAGIFEHIETAKDYDYNEIRIYLDSSELWIEGFN